MLLLWSDILTRAVCAEQAEPDADRRAAEADRRAAPRHAQLTQRHWTEK